MRDGTNANANESTKLHLLFHNTLYHHILLSLPFFIHREIFLFLYIISFYPIIHINPDSGYITIYRLLYKSFYIINTYPYNNNYKIFSFYIFFIIILFTPPPNIHFPRFHIPTASCLSMSNNIFTHHLRYIFPSYSHFIHACLLFLFPIFFSFLFQTSLLISLYYDFIPPVISLFSLCKYYIIIRFPIFPSR